MSEVKSFKSFKDFGISIPESDALQGPKIKVDKLFGRKILVHRYVLKPSKVIIGTTCMWMQISLDGDMRVVFSSSTYLQKMIAEVPYPEGFPFNAVIVRKDNDSHQFE